MVIAASSARKSRQRNVPRFIARGDDVTSSRRKKHLHRSEPADHVSRRIILSRFVNLVPSEKKKNGVALHVRANRRRFRDTASKIVKRRPRTWSKVHQRFACNVEKNVSSRSNRPRSMVKRMFVLFRPIFSRLPELITRLLDRCSLVSFHIFFLSATLF